MKRLYTDEELSEIFKTLKVGDRVSFHHPDRDLNNAYDAIGIIIGKTEYGYFNVKWDTIPRSGWNERTPFGSVLVPYNPIKDYDPSQNGDIDSDI